TSFSAAPPFIGGSGGHLDSDRSLTLRPALANIPKRINRLIVLTHLVVHVWSGRSAGASRVSDLIAAFDSLSRFDCDPRHVAVTRGDSVAVINDAQIAIAGVRRGIDYKAVCGCRYWSAKVNGDVEPLVDLAAFTVKR